MLEAKIVKVDPDNPEIDAIIEAADIIKQGGLVVYPTETCYGLGASALDPVAIKRIFLAKGRSFTTRIPIIVDCIETVKKFAFLNEKARKLAEKFWPGPLTIALRKKSEIPDILNPDRIAIRIPDHPVPIALVKKVGLPITATSANRSGEPSPYSIKEVLRSLGPVVDMILDAGELPMRKPSTIVDFMMVPSPQITREGSISVEAVLKTLGSKKENWHKHTLYLP